MSEPKRHMDGKESRKLARIVRSELRAVPPPAMDKVAADSGISRAHAYRVLKMLESWESQSTFKEEAADLNAKRYEPFIWSFMSGRMILAYIRGEIDKDIFGIPGVGNTEDISDSLLD